jgi:hypothetical protein
VDAPAEITDFFFSRTGSDMTFKKKNEDCFVDSLVVEFAFFSAGIARDDAWKLQRTRDY